MNPNKFKHSKYQLPSYHSIKKGRLVIQYLAPVNKICLQNGIYQVSQLVGTPTGCCLALQNLVTDLWHKCLPTVCLSLYPVCQCCEPHCELIIRHSLHHCSRWVVFESSVYQYLWIVEVHTMHGSKDNNQ